VAAASTSSRGVTDDILVPGVEAAELHRENPTVKDDPRHRQNNDFLESIVDLWVSSSGTYFFRSLLGVESLPGGLPVS
jgi:hypothetical protein